jgi:hypothetical protein
MFLNTAPSVIVARKVTRCPICLIDIQPGKRTANPGWDWGWCHPECAEVLYVNVKQVSPRRVSVPDYTPAAAKALGDSLDSQPQQKPCKYHINSERHTELRRLIRDDYPEELTQAEALGAFAHQSFGVYSTVDAARQQFLAGARGKLTKAINETMF